MSEAVNDTVIATPTRPRGKKRKVLLTMAAISIGWKVIVFTLGAAIPNWVIDDGLQALPVHHRPYGREAKLTAMALWNGPIERYGFVRRVRVLSVDSAAAAPAGAGCGGMSAHVRAYTYFAIPYSEARTVCDSGVVEYRVWRRRR
jgi:hypothetical protein